MADPIISCLLIQKQINPQTRICGYLKEFLHFSSRFLLIAGKSHNVAQSAPPRLHSKGRNVVIILNNLVTDSDEFAIGTIPEHG